MMCKSNKLNIYFVAQMCNANIVNHNAGKILQKKRISCDNKQKNHFFLLIEIIKAFKNHTCYEGYPKYGIFCIFLHFTDYFRIHNISF